MKGIYKITNKINGKFYIGQTDDLKRRWIEHKKPSKLINPTNKLYIAIKEFGIENFIFEVLEEYEECSKEFLIERETYWIDKLDATHAGYNMNRLGNFNKKIDKRIVKEIQELLLSDQECKISGLEIARRYNLSHTWVSLVNSGKMWHDDTLSYPLRPMQKPEKQIKYCVDCGKEISLNATRCESCYKKFKAKSITDTVSREELKALIRKYSFVYLGKYFGITDNTIRKWCKKYDLPCRKKDINSYSDEEWELI